MRFNDICIYYFDEDLINNLYYQLPNSLESSSVEKEKNLNISLSAVLKSFLLKLIGNGIDINSETTLGILKRETVTRQKVSVNKLIDILEAIDEKEFKDIYYLIDKYLQNDGSIFAVGKGEFENLQTRGNRVVPEIDGVNFPFDLGELDFLLFSCQYEKESNYRELFSQLNQHLKGRTSYNYSEIVFPDEADVTTPIYSKRVFVILEPSKMVSKFGLFHTANKTFYFLGEITKAKSDYFVTPFALWGDCVIL